MTATADRRPHHVCYAVDDIERSAELLARVYGGGPFFLRERAPFDEVDFAGGEDCVWEHSIAFGLVLGQLVELKHLHVAEPPALAAGLAQGPLNHVAYVVDDLAAERAWVEGQGADWLVRARTGPFQLLYYRLPEVGLVEAVQACEALTQMDAAIAAETGRWDGTRPLRAEAPSAA
jgi:catechol 2,3-dioxygenase-like lactoylglutathione lyase family enzyme